MRAETSGRHSLLLVLRIGARNAERSAVDHCSNTLSRSQRLAASIPSPEKFTCRSTRSPVAMISPRTVERSDGNLSTPSRTYSTFLSKTFCETLRRTFGTALVHQGARRKCSHTLCTSCRPRYFPFLICSKTQQLFEKPRLSNGFRVSPVRLSSTTPVSWQRHQGSWGRSAKIRCVLTSCVLTIRCRRFRLNHR
jgi:hypothetical protein